MGLRELVIGGKAGIGWEIENWGDWGFAVMCIGRFIAFHQKRQQVINSIP